MHFKTIKKLHLCQFLKNSQAFTHFRQQILVIQGENNKKLLFHHRKYFISHFLLLKDIKCRLKK